LGTVIVVTSGKGGVGKTTAVANIGTALAQMGKRVVMVDTDIGLRNLDVVVGLENRIVYNLVDVVRGRCRLRQALVKDKHLDNLYLLPAAQTEDKSAVTTEQMVGLCRELKEDWDFVLIDCPAGIEQGFINAVAGAEEAIVVTTPEVAAVRDADRVIGLLESRGLKDPQLIINRIRPDMVRRGDMMDMDDILDILAVRLLGVIPEDDHIVVSTNRGEPAVWDKNSRAGMAFRDISRRLLGEEVPLNPVLNDGGLMQRLKRFMGLR
jgi:septum site-determining protein MinD